MSAGRSGLILCTWTPCAAIENKMFKTVQYTEINKWVGLFDNLTTMQITSWRLCTSLSENCDAWFVNINIHISSGDKTCARYQPSVADWEWLSARSEMSSAKAGLPMQTDMIFVTAMSHVSVRRHRHSDFISLTLCPAIFLPDEMDTLLSHDWLTFTPRLLGAPLDPVLDRTNELQFLHSSYTHTVQCLKAIFEWIFIVFVTLLSTRNRVHILFLNNSLLRGNKALNWI